MEDHSHQRPVVRVKPASVPPSIDFSFAYTDPKKDFDVSYHMDGAGIVEAGISEITYKVLIDRCVRPDGSRAVVVDVGANFGWFAIFAARMGCKVIAYEPVPIFHAFFEFSVHLNDLTSLIDIRKSVVSHQRNIEMTMEVPARGIWGTAGIEGLNIDRSSVESKSETFQVPSVRLEDEIYTDVLLMKVDVEGWEWTVIRGADQLLKRFTVENIVMEYSPGVAERHFLWEHMLATPAMLMGLLAEGYRIGNLGDAARLPVTGWDTPIPPLNEVTRNNLLYDMEDVRRWQVGKLGCPSPPELMHLTYWNPCGGVPESMNPRSLRSTMTHNTNLFATKRRDLLHSSRPVGILNLSDPSEKYFQTNPENVGMGGRACSTIPPYAQVKSRCHCTVPLECGEEEDTVMRAAAENRLPMNYALPE